MLEDSGIRGERGREERKVLSGIDRVDLGFSRYLNVF